MSEFGIFSINIAGKEYHILHLLQMIKEHIDMIESKYKQMYSILVEREQ